MDTHEIFAVHLRGEHRKDLFAQKQRRADADILCITRELIQTDKTPTQVEELAESAREVAR